jgi:hypothetical protein
LQHVRLKYRYDGPLPVGAYRNDLTGSCQRYILAGCPVKKEHPGDSVIGINLKQCSGYLPTCRPISGEALTVQHSTQRNLWTEITPLGVELPAMDSQNVCTDSLAYTA